MKDFKESKFVSFFLAKNVLAITLYPFGIYKNIKYDNASFNRKKEVLYNHENIHWLQQKELFGIFFYIIYLLEWFIKGFIKLFKLTKYSSYRNISFEHEAYNNEYNFNYIQKRKKFSSFKYIFVLK